MDRLAIIIGMLITLAAGPNCSAKAGSSLRLTSSLDKPLRIVFGLDINQLIICDFESMEDYSARAIRIDKIVNLPDSSLWVGSDAHRFFFCTDNQIYALDMAGNVLFQYSLSDFNEGVVSYTFGDQLIVSGNSLLVSIDLPEITRAGVIEWDMQSAPGTSIYRSYELTKEVAPFGRTILNLGTEGGMYTVDKTPCIAALPLDYSAVFSSSGTIYLAGDTIDDRQLIGEGFDAKWGKDGNVYYAKNSSELWQYNVQRKKKVRVFSTQLKPCRNVLPSASRFILTKDRRFLAFTYINPFQDGNVNSVEAYRCGLILLDIERNEYIELPPTWFYQLYLDLHAKNQIQLEPETYRYLIQKKHFLHLNRIAIHIAETNKSE